MVNFQRLYLECGRWRFAANANPLLPSFRISGAAFGVRAQLDILCCLCYLQSAGLARCVRCPDPAPLLWRLSVMQGPGLCHRTEGQQQMRVCICRRPCAVQSQALAGSRETAPASAAGREGRRLRRGGPREEGLGDGPLRSLASPIVAGACVEFARLELCQRGDMLCGGKGAARDPLWQVMRGHTSFTPRPFPLLSATC